MAQHFMPNSFETQINKGFSLIEGNLHSCSETMWRNHVIWHQSQRWNENCLCCIFGGKWIYLWEMSKVLLRLNRFTLVKSIFSSAQ